MRGSATFAVSCRFPGSTEILPAVDVQPKTRRPGPEPLPVRANAPRCLAECDGAGVALLKGKLGCVHTNKHDNGAPLQVQVLKTSAR